MKRIAAILIGLLAAVGAVADEADLVNEAMNKAMDAAQASLQQAAKVGPDVKRIGVATLENDETNATALAKSMLTKTEYDVVLTNDVDWGPLLDEFARQVRREDLMIKETAHELRVQGVDAVLYGTVEKASVEAFQEGSEEGQRATVRLLLNLASLSETNPGSLLWSEQVTGTAEVREALSPEEQAVTFFVAYRIPLLGVCGVLVLILLLLGYRKAITPR